MVEESCVGLGTGQRWMVGENVLDLRGAMFGSFLIYIQGFHVGLPRGERNKKRNRKVCSFSPARVAT